MGPVVLFDKSFLECINPDESVWFDHFFCPNICPMFFVETLADLEKAPRPGFTPEDTVRVLANKAPQVSGNPNAHHNYICKGELSGAPVAMHGSVIIPGGRAVTSGGRVGVIHDQPPEAIAFQRWQRREFQEAERLVAKGWREQMKAMDLANIESVVAKVCPPPGRVRDLANAKLFADGVVGDAQRMGANLALANFLIGIPDALTLSAGRRWAAFGPPPLTVCASYTAHVLSVMLFFYYATAAGLVSKERVSNVVDMAYLFYLPFCSIFTSSDKLHRRCAPLFLRDDQEFIWGGDLKNGLAQLDAHYDQLPEETKRTGISAFAARPPKEDGFLVADLWDRHCGDWRNTKPPLESMTPEAHESVVKKVNQWKDAEELSDQSLPTDHDMVILERLVDRKRGKWWQVPEDID